MTRLAAVLAFVLAASAPASAAEPAPLVWPSHRQLANVLSDVTVTTAIVLDTHHAWHDPDPRHALISEACRIGLTLGVTTVVKYAVHRTRPDGSDDHSFWSGHTAMAMQASGWRYSVGVPIAIGTGYFRMAAGKHYATDVAAGAGMGLLSQWVCC